MKDHYPSEKFSIAVSTLAGGTERLQVRVANAFAHSLTLLLNHPTLPEDIGRKLEQHQAAWGAVTDPSGEGTIYVWAKGLSDDDAMEIARWVVETAWELNREFWAAD